MAESRRILCVEDNLADFGLLQEAFQELELHHQLSHVTDGESALAYLRREGEFATAPRPDLLLLDLNLPKKSGFEVLQSLALDPAFRQIEIVILTTTARELDVKRAAGDLRIHFITKPMDFDAFLEIVRQIDRLAREGGAPRLALSTAEGEPVVGECDPGAQPAASIRSRLSSAGCGP